MYSLTAATKYDNYQLRLEDNFDTLNDSIWSSNPESRNAEFGFPPYGGNDEKQCYVDSAISIVDGYLAISAQTNVLDESCPGKNETSGRLSTFGKVSVGPGTIVEARIRFPSNEKGTFAAFWLLPNTLERNWPVDGELDIVEYWGTSPNYGPSNVNSLSGNGERCSVTSDMFMKTPLSDVYNTYTMKYEAEEITFYVNGYEYAVITKEDAISRCNNGNWPYDLGTEFFVILNLASNGLQEDTEMYVNWFRIYDKIE